MNERKLLVGVGFSTVAVTVFVFVGLFTFVIGSIFCTPASAQTTASSVPAETQSALKAALADPPVSLGFLVEVCDNADVAAYMKYAPIVVELGIDLQIYFSSQSEYPVYIQLVDSCGASIVTGGDQLHLDCEGDDDLFSCCTEIGAALRDYRQSDFWAAFSNALQTGKK